MKELLKNFEPKKLWLLRIYVKFLEGISSLILVFYCGASIYLMFKESNTFINIIMGATGIYIVIVAVTILILAQVINLFIGIHDNVDDIRKKQLDPNFKYSEADEKLKVRNEQINSIYIIFLIILSIIFIFINFNIKKDDTKDVTLSHNQDTIPENKPNLDYSQLVPILKKELIGGKSTTGNKIDESNEHISIWGEDCEKYYWNRNKLLLKDIDNDGLIDYTIEVHYEGGCASPIVENYRYTLFGSKQDEFIMTHYLSNNGEEWVATEGYNRN
jgi:succinate dehydrogenase hydrophobic anchor subunit